MDQVPGLLPTAEFGDSGKALGSHSANDGSISKAWVGGDQANPAGLRWFYYFWVQVWKQQMCSGPPGNGSVAWERLHGSAWSCAGPVGCINSTSF